MFLANMLKKKLVGNVAKAAVGHPSVDPGVMRSMPIKVGVKLGGNAGTAGPKINLPVMRSQPVVKPAVQPVMRSMPVQSEFPADAPLLRPPLAINPGPTPTLANSNPAVRKLLSLKSFGGRKLFGY